MKIIYIEPDTFKCHTVDDGALRAIETTEFDGICDDLIECYRFVPMGESWTREDGEVFIGQMVTPWKDPSEFDEMQQEYERQLIAEYEAALAEIEAALGV